MRLSCNPKLPLSMYHCPWSQSYIASFTDKEKHGCNIQLWLLGLSPSYELIHLTTSCMSLVDKCTCLTLKLQFDIVVSRDSYTHILQVKLEVNVHFVCCTCRSKHYGKEFANSDSGFLLCELLFQW